MESGGPRLPAGIPADTISSDLNGAGLTDEFFDFPNVLSKFLLLGTSLDQVVARGTFISARPLPALKDLGTLRTGAVADISVLELAEGDFEFVDSVQEEDRPPEAHRPGRVRRWETMDRRERDSSDERL